MNSFYQINFILTIISLFIFIKSNNIIEVDIHYKDNQMKFFFEDYPNPITISFNHAYTYISQSYLKYKHKDIQSYPPPQGTNEYFSDYSLYYDDFKFKNSSIPFKMYFYAKDIKYGNSLQHFSDHLTFRYNQTRNIYSIVIEMYKQNVITKPQFGISILNSKLYFGGIPNKTKLHNVVSQKLNTTLLEKMGWYTDFSYILIGKTKHDYSQKKYIALLNICGSEISKTVMIPNETMTYLQNSYFIPYNKEKNCYKKTLKVSQVGHFHDAGERYFCKHEIAENFPSFEFGLNKQKIQFKGKEFFDCEQQYTNDNYCIFEMNGKDGIGNNFYLSITFFKHLLLLFDYNVPKVELFDEIDYAAINYVNIFHIQKSILITNSILLILAVSIIEIIKKISF